MSQRRVRVDVEDGERIPPLLNASFVEDDGDEVHTGTLEERSAGGVREKPDVRCGYVPNDVRAIIHHGDAGKALIVHETQRFC